MFKNIYELYDAFVTYFTRSDYDTTLYQRNSVLMSKLHSTKSTGLARKPREEVKTNYFAGLNTVDVLYVLVVFTSCLLIKWCITKRIEKSVSIRDDYR